MSSASERRLCFVVLDHRRDEYFADLVRSIRRFCPTSDIVHYHSGPERGAVSPPVMPEVPVLGCSKRLDYARVTIFFLEMLEWMTDQDYDAVVNVETDLAFISPGYERLVGELLDSCDYVIPRFEPCVSPGSRWRPFHSLRSDRSALLDLLGIDHLNGGFSPAQVFTRRFADALLTWPSYRDLQVFVERNRVEQRSFTLQEVLFPTLVEVLGLRPGTYPPPVDRKNRYRPYHSARSVSAAAADGVPFVHPIRRDPAHAARAYVRSLVGDGVGRHGR